MRQETTNRKKAKHMNALILALVRATLARTGAARRWCVTMARWVAPMMVGVLIGGATCGGVAVANTHHHHATARCVSTVNEVRAELQSALDKEKAAAAVGDTFDDSATLRLTLSQLANSGCT